MAFSMAGGSSPTPQINITPLIDVLLVLIIVFMVVVSMSKEKGLKAQIPQPANEQQKSNDDPERTIVIQVTWSGKNESPVLKINQETVKWESLEARLHDIYKQRAERIAFVRGDNDIDFQYVADVIDMARDAGVERVGLLGNDQ
jgi:biopolymer transport protein TolR